MIKPKIQTKRRSPRYSEIYARLRSLLSRYRLPPGELVRLDEMEKANRCFLLEQANPHFPASGTNQWLFQGPPAESKSIAAGFSIDYRNCHVATLRIAGIDRFAIMDTLRISEEKKQTFHHHS